MRLSRLPNGSWEIRDIHPLFAGLLSELPRTAARHDKAGMRLYPDPVHSASHEDLCRDWRQHVRPELQRLFSTNREIVQRDLAQLGADGLGTRLVLSAANLDAWLNVLNQARLIIVEENEFGEKDLDHNEPPDLATRRGLALLKVHFYAHLQELLLEAAA